MRWYVWAATAAALVALASAAARRTDQDFEFDDDVEAVSGGGGARAPRRYVYEPHNSLCRSLVCKKREVCVLRDAFTALCASKKDILRRGDVIVTASTSAWEAPARDRDDDEEDVFYDSSARDPRDPPADEPRPDRCVGCGSRTRGQFLCGSDNRTYSSLCRLDLHNCVHRGRRPVTLACRGFCPCAEAGGAPPPPPPPPAPRRPHRGRLRAPQTHYEYQHYDDEWRRRRLDPAHNEVVPQRAARRRPAHEQGAEGCALDKMANRLLDWFSVLMDEAGEMAPPEDGFPEDCKPEIRWMFVHLDTDGDGSLSPANLYSLRHDERERCLRPFLSSCGGGGGGAGGAGVSRAAWCACLRRAARPCTALARAHPDPHPGAYVPACDARGFYRPRQCHAALGVCWCVDPHGVEVPGSRAKGSPTCPGEKSSGARERDDPGATRGAGAGGAGGVPDDDEDGGASGDRELRY